MQTNAKADAELTDSGALGSLSQSIEDDGLYDLAFVRRFFGGTKPLHAATIYRGIATGRYPRPVRPSPNVCRWVGAELKAAKEAIIAAPRDPVPSPRLRMGRGSGARS